MIHFLDFWIPGRCNLQQVCNLFDNNSLYITRLSPRDSLPFPPSFKT